MTLCTRSLISFWCGFLLFSSIFAFKLPYIGNSSHWSFLLIVFSLLLIGGSFSFLKILIKHKIFYAPLVVLTFAIIATLFISVFLQTYDITMLKTWVNNLFAYIAMSVLACVYVSSKNSYKAIFKLVFIIFIVQAVIVWLMMVIPPLRDVIQALTKDAATMARMEEYGGARGGGLTSFAAFGFSTVMGLLALFMNFYFAEFQRKKSLIIKLFISFIVLIAAISAGRSSIAGFGLGIVFYYFSLGIRLFFVGSFKVLIISVMLLTPIIIYILSVPALTEVITSYYQYAFQFIYKYFIDGYVGHSSLNTLQTMYFPLTESQILWGDGMYTGNDGAYYLHTDPGFMRFILMLGLLPSVIIYFGFFWVIFNYYMINKSKVNNVGVLSLTVTILALVFHYKGEVIMYNVSFMKLIYFIFISMTLVTFNKKFNIHK